MAKSTKDYKKLYEELSERISELHKFADQFGAEDIFNSPIINRDWLHDRLKAIAYGKKSNTKCKVEDREPTERRDASSPRG